MPQFVKKQLLSQYPRCDRALSSTAVSWQHGADLNVLAIQLLASLHLSLQCCRAECTEWSDEDKVFNQKRLRTKQKQQWKKKIIAMLCLVHLPLSSGYSTSNIVHINHTALRGWVKANHPFEEDILLPSTQPKGCNSTLLTGQLMYSLHFKLVSVQVKFDNASRLFTTDDVMQPLLCNLTSNSKKSCCATSRMTTPLIGEEYLPVNAVALHASLYL